MLQTRRVFIDVILSQLLWLVPACRVRAEQVESSVDTINVALAETYLNKLTTLEATFREYDIATKKTRNGHIWMEWATTSGRLRVEYSPPLPDIMVANIVYVYYYDAETHETHHYETKTTAFWYILRKPIQLEQATKKVSYNNDMMSFWILAERGLLALNFGTKPLRLIGWNIIDQNPIAVSLSISQTGEPIDPRLFLPPK
jgi:hypothetical protein